MSAIAIPEVALVDNAGQRRPLARDRSPTLRDIANGTCRGRLCDLLRLQEHE